MIMARKTHSTEAVSIESDISESLDFLQSLGANRDKVMRRVLGSIGTAAKASAKKAYKSYGLSKSSGALFKSITRRVIRSGKAVIVEAKAQDPKNNVFYGYALAKGAHITAKNGKYLTFCKDGKWVKVHSVKLPERDFIAQPVKTYLSTTAFKDKLDAIVEREVQKLEEGVKKS